MVLWYQKHRVTLLFNFKIKALMAEQVVNKHLFIQLAWTSSVPCQDAIKISAHRTWSIFPELPAHSVGLERPTEFLGGSYTPLHTGWHRSKFSCKCKGEQVMRIPVCKGNAEFLLIKLIQSFSPTPENYAVL